MRRLLLYLLLSLMGIASTKAQEPEPDVDELNWNESQWKEYMEKFQELYGDAEAEVMNQKAYEWAMDNGVTTTSLDEMFNSVTDELAGNIADKLLDQYGSAIVQDLMQEVNLASMLDQAYEELLKNVLPEQQGIPVFDPLLKKGIEDKNKKNNEQVMLKSAIENWLNQKWKKHTAEIYAVQRGDIEYLKKIGMIRLLKMAEIEYEEFVSLETQLPDQVLQEAKSIYDVYTGSESTFHQGNKLYAALNLSVSDLENPNTLQQYQHVRHQVLKADLTTWEMINLRKKSLALAYNQLAERAKEKADDLQQQLKKKGHFKMSEGDRVKAHAITHEYMQDFLHYKKKAEDLLRSSLANEGLEKKEGYMGSYLKHIRLKNLAE